MPLEQVVLTMINDKMLDNGQISEKLHSSCLLYTSPSPRD